MKKVLRPLCCLLVAALMSTALILPALAATVEDSSPEITYLAEFDGYYVKNLSPQEIIAAFDNDPRFIPCTNEVATLSATDLAVTEANADAALASMGVLGGSRASEVFTKSYAVTAPVTGAYGETVVITYTALMYVKTVKISGKSYECFVDTVVSPTFALPSGIYTTNAGGTSSTVGSVSHGGSVLTIHHVIQLEAAMSISSTAGVSAEWIENSTTIGKTIYLRSDPQTIEKTIQLPLYNLLY